MPPKINRHQKHITTKTAKSRHTIHIKNNKRGLLHKKLNVPQTQPIPAPMLVSQPTDSPPLAKEKNFARNAKKFGH